MNLLNVLGQYVGMQKILLPLTKLLPEPERNATAHTDDPVGSRSEPNLNISIIVFPFVLIAGQCDACIIIIIFVTFTILILLMTACYHECCEYRIFDCRRYQEFGYTASGVYHVTPRNMLTQYEVYCDMETDGGGWMVRNKALCLSSVLQVYSLKYCFYAYQSFVKI